MIVENQRIGSPLRTLLDPQSAHPGQGGQSAKVDGAAKKSGAKLTLRVSLGTILTAVVFAGSLSSAAAATAPSLGNSKPSSVRGLPVPEQAVLVASLDNHRTVDYFLPPNVSLTSLDQWYRKHLPLGKPWHGWKSCIPLSHAGTGLTRDWKRLSSDLNLDTAQQPGRTEIFITEIDFPKGIQQSAQSC
jgi:hypothetical protein